MVARKQIGQHEAAASCHCGGSKKKPLIERVEPPKPPHSRFLCLSLQHNERGCSSSPIMPVVDNAFRKTRRKCCLESRLASPLLDASKKRYETEEYANSNDAPQNHFARNRLHYQIGPLMCPNCSPWNSVLQKTFFRHIYRHHLMLLLMPRSCSHANHHRSRRRSHPHRPGVYRRRREDGVDP